MTTSSTPSILRSLRQLAPHRTCSFTEALHLAERQAAKLCTLLAASCPSYQLTGITEHHLAQLPRIRIVREPLPVSGMSHWNGREWIICLNRDDPEVRQRFTLLHEFKHIIDHGQTHWLYTTSTTENTKRRWSRLPLAPREQAERVADFFAGCALVPRTALKQAWAAGLQTSAALAEYFTVSRAAIRVRIDQTGIARQRDPEPDPSPARCARPIHTPRWQPQQFIIQQPHYGGR
ncbi:MAG: ImmA/IrrE family metallo-endopeptidase [Propionibacteriaceae bacterium]|nr:ImmA/IrrE family metallo-endopeptidase [Propionibacteriaceae bacterium]